MIDGLDTATIVTVPGPRHSPDMKETSLSADRKAAHTVPQAIDALQQMVNTPTGRAHLLRQIDGFITYAEGTLENIEKARGLIRTGHVPVLYANHQSHADKLVLSGIVQSLVQPDVDDQGPRLVVPVAATIESGAQGAYVQRLMSLFEPLYLDRGYGPDAPLTTHNDRQTRGIESSNTESLRRLMNAPRDNIGLVIFPEATLQGGRRGGDGALNGIQEVTPGTGSGLIGFPRSWLKRRMGEAVFIPVGISGSYRLYPPDPGRNEISPRVITDILEGEPTEALVVASTGDPFTYADLKDGAGEEPDPKNKRHLNIMMDKVAELLPAEQGGFYNLTTG